MTAKQNQQVESSKPLAFRMLELIMIAATYYVATRVGLLYVAQPEGIATIWPSSGVAIAAVLLTHRTRWFSVFVVLFVTNTVGNLAGGNSLPVSLGFACANICETIMGAWFLVRLCGPRITFERVSEILTLGGVAVFGNAVTALIGAAVTNLAFGAPYFQTWSTWWVADGLGILLMTPVILSWATVSLKIDSWKRLTEGTILLVLVCLASWWIFDNTATQKHMMFDIYIVFPIMMWTALRFHQRLTVTLIFAFAIIVIGLTIQNYHGLNQPLKEYLKTIQLLVSISGISIMTLCAAVSEARETRNKLLESETNYRDLVEGTNDLITKVNAEGNFIFVNNMSKKYLGLSPKEAIGHSAFEFVHPDDRESTQKWFKECVEQNFPKATTENRQVNSRTHEIIHMLWTSNFEYDKKGHLISNKGIGRDITHLKRAEEALKQVNYELEEKVQQRTQELKSTHEQLLHAEKLSAISRMYASIAHEFNNPLAGITNVIHGLKQRATYDEDDAILIDMAIQECSRIKNLIQNLQDFNRPSSGKPAPMDLHTAIDNLLILGKKDYQTKGITIETHFAGNMPKIHAVADQIKQVMLNLLNNAAYACKPGGTIQIGTELKDDTVCITVSDNGTGIQPDHVQHIFEPFFTTKPEVKGTGLGLSVSYGIIKNHGGRIDVKSDPGIGTTFTVTLPLRGGKDEEQIDSVG